MQNKFIKNSGTLLGFTLAEVLITLGVIGVVAAMTLPTLIANYQKKVLGIQLKKEVSVIENYFRQIKADEGVDYIYQTSVFVDDRFLDFEKFCDYFKLEYMPENSKFNKPLTSVGGKGAYNKDGSCFGFETLNYSTIYLDVNCDKGPNKIGYDRFAWTYMAELPESFIFKSIYPLTNSEIPEFKEKIKELKQTAISDEDAEAVWTKFGSQALQYLMQNNWEIDY